MTVRVALLVGSGREVREPNASLAITTSQTSLFASCSASTIVGHGAD
jgi:hypothetical protein